jgi:hypothetical protein
LWAGGGTFLLPLDAAPSLDFNGPAVVNISWTVNELSELNSMYNAAAALGLPLDGFHHRSRLTSLCSALSPLGLGVDRTIYQVRHELLAHDSIEGVKPDILFNLAMDHRQVIADCCIGHPHVNVSRDKIVNINLFCACTTFSARFAQRVMQRDKLARAVRADGGGGTGIRLGWEALLTSKSRTACLKRLASSSGKPMIVGLANTEEALQIS